MAEKQRTISREARIKGKGLHSGQDVEICFKPANVNTGIQFQRIDLENRPVIKAVAENVVNTARGTTLSSNGAEVMTIEHVCAAITGCDIDNILIEVSGPEMPIMDGSSKYFVETLEEAGTIEQNSERVFYQVTEKVEFSDGNGSMITIYPDDKLSIDVQIDFNSKVIGSQFASLNDLKDFKSDISTCKTFVFLHELEPLLKANLIKGGDLDNALIFVDRAMEQSELDHLADLFNKPKVKVLPEGILNNTYLTFQNEPARHKLLDVVGDLSLTGVRIKGKVIARKPGHHVNTEMAKILRKKIKIELKKPNPPVYSEDDHPVFDINDIKKILPHRPPFLLIDKITSMTDTVITGVKNVTMNEAFFAGHYPEEPIMPGVLQIEAMAQCGGLLLLSNIPDPENYVLYFLKIEDIKFKNKVIPGDTLNIRMKLLEPVKRGIAITEGHAFVGKKLVIEGRFIAKLAKKPRFSKD